MSKTHTLETYEENNVIQELRDRIPDIISEDAQFAEGFYLYFFLKVSSFNVDKTEKCIREIVQWRRDNKVAKAVAAEYIPEIANQFKVRTVGRTKTGFLAYEAFAGRFNFRNVIGEHGKEAVVYYWMQLLAKAEVDIVECNREARKIYGNEVSNWPKSKKCWLLLDVGDINYKDLLSREVVSTCLTLVRLAMNYFPALEGTVVFLNGGKIMDFFFKLMRPMLKGSNVDMIVFSSKDTKWKPFILEHIEPGQLLESFGGILDDELLS